MSVRRPRPRPIVVSRHGSRKKVENEFCNNIGSLSPDLQPSPPVFCKSDVDYHVSKIGKYFLVEQLEGNEVFKAIDSQTKEEFICKVFSIDKYRDVLSAYWQVDSHEHISSITEIILGKTKAYIFFDRHFGDLHSYVRQKKRLREEVACSLFQQIVTAVQHCHDNGIVLRDLKLRKFVFKDPARTQLRLDGLEDAVVLEDNSNDQLVDKHGCPAYVSPEILDTHNGYSGRAADVWSIGVMLYTMLVGRYPFHDTEPSSLFGKIRRGQFTVPEVVSSKPKCLIRSLLRREPEERLTAHQIPFHPWFHGPQNSSFQARVDQCHHDQTVPEFTVTTDDEFFS